MADMSPLMVSQPVMRQRMALNLAQQLQHALDLMLGGEAAFLGPCLLRLADRAVRGEVAGDPGEGVREERAPFREGDRGRGLAVRFVAFQVVPLGFSV